MKKLTGSLKKNCTLLMLGMFLHSTILKAQENTSTEKAVITKESREKDGTEKEGSEKEEESMKGTHRFSFELSHTHVSEGRSENGGKKWLAMPSIGLNYDYWVSRKWAVGLHCDLVTEDYKVESRGEEDVIERNKPFAPALAVVFKPTKHSSFIFGTGVEFSSEENLFLNRIGYEWGTEINKNWEVGATLAYDIRWNAYDSFAFGIGVSYLLRK